CQQQQQLPARDRTTTKTTTMRATTAAALPFVVFSLLLFAPALVSSHPMDAKAPSISSSSASSLTADHTSTSYAHLLARSSAAQSSSSSSSSSIHHRLLFRRDHKKPAVIDLANKFNTSWSRIPPQPSVNVSKTLLEPLFNKIFTTLQQNGTVIPSVNNDIRSLKEQIGKGSSLTDPVFMFQKDTDAILSSLAKIQHLSQLEQDLEGAWNNTQFPGKDTALPPYEIIKAALKKGADKPEGDIAPQIAAVRAAIANNPVAANLTKTLDNIEGAIRQFSMSMMVMAESGAMAVITNIPSAVLFGAVNLLNVGVIWMML
ncbi:hypothetical protein HK102_001008, partial [Quaeritorhiza haematococci]